MSRRFSTLYNILEEKGVAVLNDSVKNTFTYKLHEGIGARNRRPLGQAIKWGSKLGNKGKEEPAATTAPVQPPIGTTEPTTDSVPPEQATTTTAVDAANDPEAASSVETVPDDQLEPGVDTTVADMGTTPAEAGAAQGYHDIPAGENPVTAPPQTTAGNAPPQPTGTPPANKPSIGSRVGNVMKGAMKGVRGAADFAASGQASGSDPKELAKMLKVRPGGENSDVIGMLVNQVDGIKTPARQQELVNSIAKALGLPPAPRTATNVVPTTEPVNSSTGNIGSAINEGKFMDTVNRVGKGIQRGGEGLQTLKTAAKNLNQATGGKAGTKSDMAGFATGDLQRRNYTRKNLHNWLSRADLFSLAISDPAAFNDHPAWLEFMRTASAQERQDFLDTVQQAVQQAGAPPQTP
jgi:hypothetical protein